MQAGMAGPETRIVLGLVAGNVYQSADKKIRTYFGKNNWFFWSLEDVRSRVNALAQKKYENEPAVITAKILRKDNCSPTQKNMTLEELRNDFKTLRDQAIILRQTFDTFNFLFSADPEIDDILKSTAELFFYDLNQIMVEYLILLIGRMTDPPEMHGRVNLTIPYMTRLVCEDDDVELNIHAETRSKIEKLDRQIGEYRSLINPARNRIVAHNDREAHVYQQTLGGHTEERMEQFFDNLQEYFDETGNAIGVGPLDFRNVAGHGDVQNLIMILRNYQRPDHRP